MPGSVAPLFTWRTAIISSDLSPTTRHVLLTLSLHMSEAGASCYPSTATLARESGLSERAVCTHLDKANAAGWIVKRRHGMAGKKWARHEYAPQIPADVLDRFKPYQPIGAGAECGSVPNDENQAKSAVDKPVDNVGISCGKPNEGTEPHTQGTEPNDVKALNEVQSSTSINSSKSTSGGAPVDKSSTQDWVDRGKAVGVMPRRGEPWPVFIGRVKRGINARH